jgi:hypothetical protein
MDILYLHGVGWYMVFGNLQQFLNRCDLTVAWVGREISKIIINSAKQHSPSQKLPRILSTSLWLILHHDCISASGAKIEGLYHFGYSTAWSYKSQSTFRRKMPLSFSPLHKHHCRILKSYRSKTISYNIITESLITVIVCKFLNASSND